MWRNPASWAMFENDAASCGLWGIMGAYADFAGIVYKLLHPSFGIALVQAMSTVLDLLDFGVMTAYTPARWVPSVFTEVHKLTSLLLKVSIERRARHPGMSHSVLLYCFNTEMEQMEHPALSLSKRLTNPM